MGTIRIKNRSSLTDRGAVRRVMWYMLGSMYTAFYNRDCNKVIVNIRKRGNTYTVTDAEESI